MTSPDSGQSQYTVVARRYRPQSFGDMVGQNHISHALSNAIKQSRVGHAYLFTGARGVGKTSSARIFAKCLNCQNGPTDQPCNECDVCQSVSVGEDIDVLEIDGASNRGIDEIRQLRSNAIVRPSRATFKIYIIDEVHMLTQQAFNALLKTLEEPPDHVKFIFCTTDPQKIPITVLSRCQRFDFSPVQTPEIINRLKDICSNEKIEVEDEALAALARRAAGSVRDSQSLLEQLLSFCETKITIDNVHQLLGTADIGRITEIADAVIAKSAADGLNLVSTAIQSGVDAGQLTTQLMGYFRDIMAVRVGASSETLLTCAEADFDDLKLKAETLGLETTIGIVQVLDKCITRMQSSLHGRTLLEVAVVRICNLENLDVISDLVQQIGNPRSATKTGAPENSAAKKNSIENSRPASQGISNESATPTTPQPVAAAIPSAAMQHREPQPNPAANLTDSSAATNTAVLTAANGPSITGGASLNTNSSKKLNAQNLPSVWKKVAEAAGGMTEDMLQQYKSIQMAGTQVIVTYVDRHVCEFCRRPDKVKSIETEILNLAGQEVRVEFRLDEVSAKQTEAPRAPKMTRVQMIRQLEQNELIKSAIEIFEAEIVEFYDNRQRQ